MKFNDIADMILNLKEGEYGGWEPEAEDNTDLKDDVQSVDQELMDVFMAIKYGEIDYKKFKAFVDSYIAKKV